MKYMLLMYGPPAADGGVQCEFEEWVTYDKALREAGVLVSGYALKDVSTATTVRVGPAGERTVTTDGPFAETREILGGYDVIDVPDLDVALEWAARCPGARYGGSVVVRPIDEFEA
ncbi:YciI family protein [Streptosporangium sp. NPDC002721]|uniref:YciI family protein n=1 Tax=Streptosporangium sp. NPDC002721 TaxID=3366188 RepID=UPI003674061A